MANRYQNPVTDDERRRIREMHAVGFSRNQIARKLGRSHRTITIHANEMGLEFDRHMTEAATAARKADLAERRVLLAEALQGDAEKLTERIWQKYRVFNFGGSDNRYSSKLVDEPPAEAQRNLMQAAATAIDRSLKLCPPETDTEGLAAVDAWLKGMIGGE